MSRSRKSGESMLSHPSAFMYNLKGKFDVNTYEIELPFIVFLSYEKKKLFPVTW